MIRTFQPVGHGAFVTEQFGEGQNVILDCGSTTSVGLIKDLIHTNFQQRELVDGVFLSMLDREHAGGLEALLQHCRVAKVFIPYLQEDEKAYMLLKYLCEGGKPEDLLARLIAEPTKALSAYQILDPRQSMVTQVAEETDREKNVFDADMSLDVMPFKAIEGFRVYVDFRLDWVFEPHVYRQRASIDQLREVLIEEKVDPGWLSTVAHVKRGWIQNPIREALKRAFGRLDRPVCPVTMTVYSGPKIADYRMYEQFTENGQWSYRARVRAGGLYTGDMMASEERIRSKFLKDYDRYLTRVGSLLLPGYGAEEMFHEDILPRRQAIVVSTSDTENVLCLPHGKVVRRILEQELPYYVVTEVPGSLVRFVVLEKVI